MRWLMILTAALSVCGRANCEDIASVLQRSQQQRLDQIELADPAGVDVRRVHDSFGLLLQALHWVVPVELRVSRGATPIAETLRGDVVVATAGLAALPEAERLFILAHELGHVQLGHASQMGRVFQKWVPGDVTPETTDAVAPLLGRDASGLAHRQEFEADAFAMRTLLAMGRHVEQVLPVFRRAGRRIDTPTHPGIQRRIDALTALETDSGESMRPRPVAALVASHGDGR